MFASELQSQSCTHSVPSNLKELLVSNLSHLRLEDKALEGLTSAVEPISHLVSSRLNKLFVAHIVRQVPNHDGLTLKVIGDNLLISWDKAVEGRGLSLREMRHAYQELRPSLGSINDQIYQQVVKEYSYWKYLATCGFTSVPVVLTIKVSADDLGNFAKSHREIGGILFTYTEYEGLVADWGNKVSPS